MCISPYLFLRAHKLLTKITNFINKHLTRVHDRFKIHKSPKKGGALNMRVVLK